MIEKFAMPQMGESITEGTVAKWLVSPGDKIILDQSLVEIATDKVDTEIPSPFAGKIIELYVKEGETVPVGTNLVAIDTTTASKPTVKPPVKNTTQSTEPKITITSSLDTSSHENQNIEVKIVAPPKKTQPLSEIQKKDAGFLSPAVKRLIAKHNIDPAKVMGTGKNGRITRQDILRITDENEESPDTTTPATTDTEPALLSTKDGKYSYKLQSGDHFEPFSPIRKKIAEHMVYSKSISPHVTCVAEVDMTSVVQSRSKSKAEFKNRFGVNLTYLPFISYATIKALLKYPLLNSSVMNNGVVTKKAINLSIAVDTQYGLMVPVIKSAEKVIFPDLASNINKVATTAKDKKLTLDDISGGSFTITNPGREGNLFGTPIINQPQVGILRLGEIVKRPMVCEIDGADAIGIRHMSYFTLSYDHRIIDGVYGNSFLHFIKTTLEQTNFSGIIYADNIIDGEGT